MSTPEPHVVVVGDALIDELRSPTGTEEHVGGAALNVAVGLRVLGVDATLLAMVGADEAGSRIARYLSAWGVELCATPTPDSSRATSDRSEGEPRYRFNEAARNRHIAFDARQRALLANAHVIVVSCFPFDDQEQFDLLVDATGGGGRRVLLDANPRAGMMKDRELFVRNFEALASNSMLTKIGDEDSELLYGLPLATVAERILEQGASTVLATAGARGASFATPELSCAAGVVMMAGPIVDTMGAGDATLASVTASIAYSGMPDNVVRAEKMLAEAMGVAAATCRQPGALLRLPDEQATV